MAPALFELRRAPSVVAIAVACGLAPQGASAQARVAAPPTRLDAAGDPTTPDLDLAAIRRRSGFRLFAASELAAVGIRGIGDLGSFVSNVGPCDLQFTLGRCHNVRGTAQFPASWRFQTFGLQLIAGVPPSDWSRAASRASSLQSARGGGWSVMQNFSVVSASRPLEIGPADGSLGTLFSGASSTADGSCLDHTGGENGFVDAGTMSLAASDCPATWPGGGFAGEFRIPAASWSQLFAQQGSAFRFDRHRVPDALRNRTRFLGDFSTYGLISDHRREVLASYGAVVPGGVDSASIQGWPLGLEFFFRVYAFQDTRIASAYIWEMVVVNRSERVYGVGLDYDSLYLGIEHAPDVISESVYWDAARSTMIWHSGGVNPTRCQESGRTPPGVSNCSATSPSRGYRSGGNAIVWLKSPYGDQRNKLFARAGSPFYDPSHPAAGDTILMNHGHMCGFGGCWASTFNVNERRSFGMLSSTEANVLDGRVPATLIAIEAWRIFRTREYPALRGFFNKWVPGGFDPDHDGVQDTLFFDTCGGRTPADMALGCVTLDADTMPGGQINAYGNSGGITAAGPFRLAAGDTAAFTWAFVGARDSANTMATINALIAFYQDFYPQAEPAAVARIVSTTVNAGGRDSRISLLYSEDAERWVDDYLLKYATDIDSAPPGTELARLRALNPGLSTLIRNQAADNLEQLEVYKSCDGGVTFTADSSCRAAPLVDAAGQRVGHGWRPYAVHRRQPAPAPGFPRDLPNQFTDEDVLGGRRYLYAIVGRTRGARFIVRDSVDTDGDGSLDGVGGRELVLAPALANPLDVSSSEPNVVSIYVPASRQAGGVAASVAFSPPLPRDRAPFVVQVTDAPVAGTYRAVFGDRITLVETRSAARVESTVVTVEDVVSVDSAGTAVSRSFDAERGTSYAPDGVINPFAHLTAPPGTTTRVLTGLGLVVFRDRTPLLAGLATPASGYTNSAFPGFVVTVFADSARRLARLATLGPSGDTLPTGGSADSMVTWRQDLAAVPLAGPAFGGDYHVRWLSDAFGAGPGVEINALPAADSLSTESQLRRALASRPVGDTGSVDSTTAAAARVSQASLVAVRMPFTIVNTTTGGPVTVAMRQRTSPTRVLGTPPDTVRVTLPDDLWVPGDDLYLIEQVEEDSTVNFRVVLNPSDRDADGNARPFRVVHPRLTFSRAVLGCPGPRILCNPVRAGTPGATGYVPLEPGSVTGFLYYTGFSRSTDLTFTVTAPVSGTAITAVSRAQLDSIRVVPNPFVGYSAYQTSGREPRVIFTHMPPRGTLRIYTVSGQFVQRITWTEADLDGAGDLHYDLRTREGRLLASGLYVWVVVTEVGGTRSMARGKFVVIR